MVNEKHFKVGPNFTMKEREILFPNIFTMVLIWVIIKITYLSTNNNQ